MNISKGKRHAILAMTAFISAAGLMFGPVAGASADEAPVVPLSQTEEQQIRDLLTKYDVPAADQDVLVEKTLDGVLWDVNSSGTVPSSTEKAVIDGFNYTIERFADGSVSATGLEIPVEAPSARAQVLSIVGCTYTTGSGYSNASGCQVDGVWGPVIIGATDVAYTLVQGGPDQITNAGVPFQQCLPPVACSTPALVVSELTEGMSPANIRWQSDVTSTMGGSWNNWVDLSVGNDSATEVTS